MNFYISDLHLGHERINLLCSRPFTAKSFNDFLLEKWNKRIKKDDNVYILGDIGMNDSILILEKLNGIKHLIIGNHDEQIKLDKYKHLFVSIDYQKMISDNGKKIFLCHYPIMDWPGIEKGYYHLYGHIHNKDLIDIKRYYKNRKAYNVSCEVIGYLPKTLSELIKLKENNHDSYIN